MRRSLAAAAGKLILTLLLAGFFGALLIRLAPGFGVEESDLDPRLSAESRAKLEAARGAKQGVAAFYGQYLASLARGDLGEAQSFRRPIRELLADRYPVTLRTIGAGLLFGWLAAAVFAGFSVTARSRWVDGVLNLLAGQFLCVPAALLGYALFLLAAPPAIGIAAIVFPRVFRFVEELLRDGALRPHVAAAEARGVPRPRLVIFHVIPPVLPQVIALGGISVTVALGAAIPLEAICDSPGLGQLAWKAAQGRDMPLLVTLTLLITAVALAANLAADSTIAWLDRSRS